MVKTFVVFSISLSISFGQWFFTWPIEERFHNIYRDKGFVGPVVDFLDFDFGIFLTASFSHNVACLCFGFVAS